MNSKQSAKVRRGDFYLYTFAAFAAEYRGIIDSPTQKGWGVYALIFFVDKQPEARYKWSSTSLS